MTGSPLNVKNETRLHKRKLLDFCCSQNRWHITFIWGQWSIFSVAGKMTLLCFNMSIIINMYLCMTLKERVYLLDQLWVCLLSFIRSHWFFFILLNKTAKQLLFFKLLDIFLCSRQLPATPFIVCWLLCHKSLMFFCKGPLKKYHTMATPASRKSFSG